MSDVADYTEQPPPLAVDGAVSVHDLVVEDLRALESEIVGVEIGAGAVLERKEFGLQKYGVVLHAANGRDYFKDVDDEAGDLPVYIRALMEARPDLADRLHDDYYAALGIMIRMRMLLMEQSCPSV